MIWNDHVGEVVIGEKDANGFGTRKWFPDK